MLTDRAHTALDALLDESRVITDPAELLTYESDASFERGMPHAVAFPHSAQEVAAIVRWAAEHQLPLVARGAGTGLSGGAVATHGGLVVEFAGMNRVLELDARGCRAVVEPGVPNLRLDELARREGLYYPPDPSSQRASTLGGNVAENAGGPHCFKYGVTTNYVTGLQIVLADGQVARVGGRALDYPEYDLTGLIVGSEGTLALITAIYVRLVRNPPGVKTMMAIFDSVAQCGAAVSAVIAAGLVPATLELMDGNFARAVEEYAHAGLPMGAGAVLIAEVDGYPASLDSQMEEIAQILGQHGGRNTRTARDAQEREQIWRARKSAAGVFAHLAPSYYLVDITVPRSRLAQTLEQSNEICHRHQLHVQYVLHAGDGNLHPVLLIPSPEDPQLIQAIHRAAQELVELAVRENGSLTGEHGVGTEKREHMPLMFSAAELSAMWDVKQVFDPLERLNPGKIFPHPFPKEPIHPEPPPDLSKLMTPSSVGEAARVLGALYIARRRVQIGAGTRGDGRLSSVKLTGIINYAPDDLYVTVGAGTRLSDLQAYLARDRNQVPLASPWREATVGGMVAANLNAPLRMRYGSLRDLVLEMTVVLGDGRVIRAGRPVVKNVAGYDLVKVFVGSHGSLGFIADVTLKLFPLPRACRTLLWRIDDLGRALLYAEQARSVALVASAIVLCKTNADWTLAYTAEGIPGDVEAELQQVCGELRNAGAPEPEEVESPTGTALWARCLGGADDRALLIRAGLAPEAMAGYVQANSGILGAFVVDLPSGLLYATRTCQEVDLARLWLDGLRQTISDREGYVIAMSLPEAWHAELDRWGYRPETLSLMRELKARWDPASILESELLNL